MKAKTLRLTRKIQLHIDLPDYEERKEAIAKLYDWQYCCFKASNIIVTHLYVQEMIKEFFYLTEEIQYKLADVKKHENGIINRSRLNSTYRVLSDRFKGQIPTKILTNLNQNIERSFIKNRPKYWSGERALENFKKNNGFPFTSESISGFKYDEDRKVFCFRLFTIPFCTYLGKDFTDKLSLLHRFIKGETRLRTSEIRLKDGKIFWYAVFDVEQEQHALKPQVIAEASLSLEYPISVKVGRSRMNIGTKEEFLYRRLAIQAARKRAIAGSVYSRGGHGRKRKLKAADPFKEKEKNYVNQRLHIYSRKLIDFCVKHQAGTLMLVDQEAKIEAAKEQHFVLRNWSYYELTQKIAYKAEKAGIELVVG
ncbi:hypothetical protein [Leeuwenhoekiella sp. NPDC079379]|uniref:hypothetical protein n=1 Tax=Leeuwenhoekiella sp. NPDC079379 TaxID=3364122 RepID=UPI0037C8C40B